MAIYLLLAVAELLSPSLRLVIMGVVLVVGISLAWVVLRKLPGSSDGAIAVGDRIESTGDISIDRVDIKDDGGRSRVGTNLKSGGKVRVGDVQVRRRKGSR